MSYLASVYDSIYMSALLTNVSYGGYVVLFATCMHIVHCKTRTIQTAHQVAIVSLFALATLGFIFGNVEENSIVKMEVFVSVPAKLEHFTNLYQTVNVVVFGIYTLANAIADFVLIQRCYIIWGCKKRVIAFPVFISVVNNGLALVRTITRAIKNRVVIMHDDTAGILGDDVFIPILVVNLFTNLLIPFMIAGRIWWIGRQVSKLIGTQKNSFTRRTVEIWCYFTSHMLPDESTDYVNYSLESGMIYPVFLIPTLVVYLSDLTYKGDAIPVLTQVVGIAPTFIIVRVALGISTENVQDTVARNTEGNGGQQTQTLMMVFADNTTGTGASV